MARKEGISVRGYAERKMIPSAIREKFELAARLVQCLDSLPEDVQQRVRCHELARAVAKTLYISGVVDGKYGIVDHSWIELFARDEGYRDRYILDVYSCGRLPMVQVLDTFFGLKHADLYVTGPLRDDIDDAMVGVLRDVMLKCLETAS